MVTRLQTAQPIMLLRVQNVVQTVSIVTVNAIILMVLCFNAGSAGTATTDSPKNHQKKIQNGQ
jgi:hypothetical protein